MSLSKTTAAAAHVTDCALLDGKISVVSKAFGPAGLQTAMADKLARLNENLLLRTIAVPERRKGHWIPFGRGDWYSLFGANYTKVKQAGVKLGMLETNERYSSRSTTSRRAFRKSLRLSEAYRTGEFSLYKLARKPRVSYIVDADNLQDAGVWLANQMHSFALTAEPRDAWDALTLALFARGMHRPFRCAYSRFHSLMTATPKYLRRGLTTRNNKTHMIYGKKPESPPSLLSFLGSLKLQEAPNLYQGPQHNELVEIDVKNCQPLILGKLAGDRFGVRSCPSDISEWIELSESGRIYEAIMAELHSGRFEAVRVEREGRSWLDDPLAYTRDRTKKAVITAMFASGCVSERMLVWQVIKARWPSIATVASAIKGKQHEALARECQKVESSLVIDGVCGHLAEHHADLPTLTIHDCVIVPRYAQSLVEELIQDHFERAGMRPQLDVSDLAKAA